ncbi:molybdate ABC transporter substrate-binding protein [Humibacter sp. RRB41]|uniref:molybdate ABC transporter substrate-binding protein n=1 Tax=Humibacter sp. RRB41 TaxID=2919946 RepID=UPI001FA9C259|nr:molybdate ABC transporter substrate-binding protein [Humibacter sp. RRB41]
MNRTTPPIGSTRSVGQRLERTGRRRMLMAPTLLVAAVVALAGCSGQTAGAASASPAASGASAKDTLKGELTVYAAASLTASFNDLAARFHTAHPNVTVKPIDYDGSQILATQIVQGAPADVFASADQKTMATVQKAGLAASAPKVFATNTLEIAVQPGNPKKIRTLSQLAASGIQTVLCAPAVPCGAAAQTLLTADGVKLTPVSEEQNVTAVITKVSTDAADAGLVYVTDVRAAKGSVDGVTIPDADKAINKYPIAAVKNAPDAAVAKAFVSYVLSSAGQKVLHSYGFGAP